MDADQWVITVASVAAAVFGAVAVAQGRRKERRDLEGEDVEWDVADMVGPEVVVRHGHGPSVSDVRVRVEWDGGVARARRETMSQGDEIRIATPGWTPVEPGLIAFSAVMRVDVSIDWRSRRRTPHHWDTFTGDWPG